MSIGLLRDLRGLKVLVLHPQDEPGLLFVDHLKRIGCMVTSVWPVPPELPHGVEVVFLTIEDDQRPAIEQMLKSMPSPKPTLLAIVSYENPATLQVMLECGALAVLGRPINPFGVLANLAIARSVWLERQEILKDLRKMKRKVAGDKKLVKAKAILMASKGLSEDDAHQYIRQHAMTKRLAMEDVANAIIHAEDLLRS